MNTLFAHIVLISAEAAIAWTLLIYFVVWIVLSKQCKEITIKDYNAAVAEKKLLSRTALTIFMIYIIGHIFLVAMAS